MVSLPPGRRIAGVHRADSSPENGRVSDEAVEHHHPAPVTSVQEQLWYARAAAELTRPTDRLVADIDAARGSVAEAGLIGRVTMITHDLTDGVDRSATRSATPI